MHRARETTLHELPSPASCSDLPSCSSTEHERGPPTLPLPTRARVLRQVAIEAGQGCLGAAALEQHLREQSARQLALRRAWGKQGLQETGTSAHGADRCCRRGAHQLASANKLAAGSGCGRAASGQAGGLAPAPPLAPLQARSKTQRASGSGLLTAARDARHGFAHRRDPRLASAYGFARRGHRLCRQNAANSSGPGAAGGSGHERRRRAASLAAQRPAFTARFDLCVSFSSLAPSDTVPDSIQLRRPMQPIGRDDRARRHRCGGSRPHTAPVHTASITSGQRRRMRGRTEAAARGARGSRSVAPGGPARRSIASKRQLRTLGEQRSVLCEIRAHADAKRQAEHCSKCASSRSRSALLRLTCLQLVDQLFRMDVDHLHGATSSSSASVRSASMRRRRASCAKRTRLRTVFSGAPVACATSSKRPAEHDAEAPRHPLALPVARSVESRSTFQHVARRRGLRSPARAPRGPTRRFARASRSARATHGGVLASPQRDVQRDARGIAGGVAITAERSQRLQHGDQRLLNHVVHFGVTRTEHTVDHPRQRRRCRGLKSALMAAGSPLPASSQSGQLGSVVARGRAKVLGTPSRAFSTIECCSGAPSDHYPQKSQLWGGPFAFS